MKFVLFPVEDMAVPNSLKYADHSILKIVPLENLLSSFNML
jgi:hypothetical protein